MIFADKIIKLRKKNGWSQEELAERMNVSRQSVSKWEGAQSVPDLNKILQLSYLFGVTTDYLLKDEIEFEVFIDDEVNVNIRKITFDEANSYIKLKKKVSLWQASAVFLCIVAVVPLLCLSGLAENSNYLSIDMAETIGIAILFILIAIAVSILILCHSMIRPYQFIREVAFELEYGVKGMLKEKQQKDQIRYLIFQITGVALCILSQIAIINGPENSFWMGVLVSIMLIMIAAGVFFLIVAQVRKSSITRLLKEGSYTEHNREVRKIIDIIAAVYWLFVTAIYLTLSFLTQAWGKSWIIWPISGVVFVLVLIISQFILEQKMKKEVL